MHRLAYLAVAFAACGVDNRPKTVNYVTEAVLAPACGAAQCHSTFGANGTDIFDTVVGTRASLIDNGLISFDSTQYDPDNPANAKLIRWLTDTDPFMAGIGRMPYDAPLPAEDLRFLEDFIAVKAPGAQCDPDLGLGYVCDNFELKRCEDWNFGAVVYSCKAPNETGCAISKCQCASGFGDCDGQVTDGCETALDVDGNCGACGKTCAGGQTCQPVMGMTGVFSCQ